MGRSLLFTVIICTVAALSGLVMLPWQSESVCQSCFFHDPVDWTYSGFGYYHPELQGMHQQPDWSMLGHMIR